MLSLSKKLPMGGTSGASWGVIMPFIWSHGVLSRRASPHQCGMQPSDFPDHQLRIIDTATCRLQVAHPAEVLKQKQRGAALHLDSAEVAHGRTQWAVSGELAMEADLTLVARRAELAILTGGIDAARCGRGDAASMASINTASSARPEPKADRHPHLHCDLSGLLTPTNSDNVIDGEQTSVYAIGYLRGHLGYATPPLSAELILTT